jgi:hypothetical protein
MEELSFISKIYFTETIEHNQAQTVYGLGPDNQILWKEQLNPNSLLEELAKARKPGVVIKPLQDKSKCFFLSSQVRLIPHDDNFSEATLSSAPNIKFGKTLLFERKEEVEDVIKALNSLEIELVPQEPDSVEDVISSKPTASDSKTYLSQVQTEKTEKEISSKAETIEDDSVLDNLNSDLHEIKVEETKTVEEELTSKAETIEDGSALVTLNSDSNQLTFEEAKKEDEVDSIQANSNSDSNSNELTFEEAKKKDTVLKSEVIQGNKNQLGSSLSSDWIDLGDEKQQDFLPNSIKNSSKPVQFEHKLKEKNKVHAFGNISSLFDPSSYESEEEKEPEVKAEEESSGDKVEVPSSGLLLKDEKIDSLDSKLAPPSEVEPQPEIKAEEEEEDGNIVKAPDSASPQSKDIDSAALEKELKADRDDEHNGQRSVKEQPNKPASTGVSLFTKLAIGLVGSGALLGATYLSLVHVGRLPSWIPNYKA